MIKCKCSGKLYSPIGLGNHRLVSWIKHECDFMGANIWCLNIVPAFFPTFQELFAGKKLRIHYVIKYTEFFK